MSKTITGAMPIRTVGLTPGHRWCGGHRQSRPAVNNGKGAPGLVHGPNSLNATYIRPGHISDRPRNLAKDLRNGHLGCGWPANSRHASQDGPREAIAETGGQGGGGRRDWGRSGGDSRAVGR